MHTEYELLQTAFEREEAERVRRELSASPDSFLSHCGAEAERAMNVAHDAAQAVEAVLFRCDEERRKWLAELGAAIDAFPIARSVFRSALSERELFEICRRLPRLESRIREMEAVCATFSKLLEGARDAEGRLLTARAQITRGVCVCRDEAIQRALGELHVRLDAAENTLAERKSVLCNRRDTWGSFCVEELPRFLRDLRQAADLANEGRSCDLAAVHRLMGQMRHRSERIF